MKIYGSLIKVKQEYEERYIILHKHTFPEVLEQIRKSNIRNYSIFLRDSVLFSYFEYIGSDFKADMAKMAEDKVTTEWWKLTDPMQEPLDSRKPGEWWASIEQVFYMGDLKKTSEKAKRFSSVIDVFPESEKEYMKLHAAVWPGVLKQIQDSNIQNYSIFLHEHRLYSYFEYAGDDFKADMDKMAADPETQRWWAVCKPLQKKVPNAAPDEWWADMKEVFHTD
jgi:L-rhamnose mutarotase